MLLARLPWAENNKERKKRKKEKERIGENKAEIINKNYQRI